MFRSPMSSFMHEGKNSKSEKAEKFSQHEEQPEDESVAKSLTINQHHDGHYSTQDGDEPIHHDDIEAVKNHMNDHFGEELGEAQDEHPGEYTVKKAEPPSKHRNKTGMM